MFSGQATACRNRTGGNQQHLPILSTQCSKLIDQARHHIPVQRTARVAQDLAADFYNDSLTHRTRLKVKHFLALLINNIDRDGDSIQPVQVRLQVRSDTTQFRDERRDLVVVAIALQDQYVIAEAL